MSNDNATPVICIQFVSILSNIDDLFSLFFLIAAPTKNSKNEKAIMMKNQNLMPFQTGSGHFDQVNSPTNSYLTSSLTTHCVHRQPVQPSLHSTGCSFCGLYPPLHASGFGQAMMSVEFGVFLQCSSSTCTCVPPNHVAKSMLSVYGLGYMIRRNTSAC